jgi:hypothetical protein
MTQNGHAAKFPLRPPISPCALSETGHQEFGKIVRRATLTAQLEINPMPPASIEVTTKVASMRQIHAAIEHEARQDFECSITLAAAGEGMLPITESEHFHKKVKAFAASLPEAIEGATGPNDLITWLKHGTFKGKKCENATIEHVEVMVTIWRAITKFHAVYDAVSPQMKSWADGTRERLAAEKAAQKA